MNIEYRMAYLKIGGEKFNPEMEVFLPDTGLTYQFEKDRPKKLEEADGSWISIDDFGVDGWELYHIIPNNLYLVGLFKRVIGEPQTQVISESFSEPIFSMFECTKEPSISFIEFNFIRVEKPKTIPMAVPPVEEVTKIELKPLIDNGDGPFCDTCGSSIKRRWFKVTGKCIHPSCPNYWNKK